MKSHDHQPGLSIAGDLRQFLGGIPINDEPFRVNPGGMVASKSLRLASATERR